jgi:LysM repeat protein
VVGLRPFAWPAAFLAAVTGALFGFRALHPTHAVAKPKTHSVHHRSPKLAQRYYRVRAGDTLTAIAAKHGLSTLRLQKLNPALNPTALFLGQRIRLR